ncbi:MAG: PAS domain S-box protein [Methylococcaceae bacterium]|nr:PAS domain S-box protein [Methylococcaceae bacterium]
MIEAKLPLSEVILDSLNDGLYVCDRDRRIVYWSKSAERITGWSASEVVGRRCSDDVLAHVDQDGRQLCGEEFCPLHRCMVTNHASSCPLIVFGLTKRGDRLPMTVSVAPIHGEDGQVVGGVETFHDFSETYANLERARRIQTLALDHELPIDSRVKFATQYLPHDMIGGDYFAIRALDSERYAFFLADVMGHGVAAALHTMHLSALWSRFWRYLDDPAEFAGRLNRELCQVVKDESFATAICGVLEASERRIRLISAGGPPIVVFDRAGQVRQLKCSGLPFGTFANLTYEEIDFVCDAGDTLLLFTDGAVEVCDAGGNLLGTDGLVQVLKSLGYPEAPIDIAALQKALLTYGDGIRLDDDLTLLEFRFT